MIRGKADTTWIREDRSLLKIEDETSDDGGHKMGRKGALGNKIRNLVNGGTSKETRCPFDIFDIHNIVKLNGLNGSQ